MFRREILIIGILAAAIFIVVGSVGWFTVRELHETTKMLVTDTLPGLVDAGLAEERMTNNRRTMFDLLNPHTPVERAQMIQLVKTNSTEPLWRDYVTSIYEPIDRQNYQAMLVVRSNYLQSCEMFFTLVSAEKADEASAFFYGDLSQMFRDYNKAAQKLFEYNVQQGIDRGGKILHFTAYTPWAIAGLCVLVFGFGLVLGVRSALSGSRKPKRKF